MTSKLRAAADSKPFVCANIVSGVIVAMLAWTALGGTARAQRARDQLAPLINLDVPSRVPDEYIVVLRGNVSRQGLKSVTSKAREAGAKLRHTYQSVVSGFSANLSASTLRKVREFPEVAYIEVEQVGTLNTVQAGPPAGLDRISERLQPLDNRYTYSEQGTGVHVYILDTGIRATHSDFGGRVGAGVNTMNSAAGTGDCHGHGTHVAGTVGGTGFGVAKNVTLHPVRAGDCSDTYLAPMIAAVDWVTLNHIAPAVANLSSGFAGSPTLDTAVRNSIAAGVTYTIAAGNAGIDACTRSPARVLEAITVGAIDPTTDLRADFPGWWGSNIGPCVDLFAPGVDTESAGIVDDMSTAIMSGTSMAAPHVAGVAARYLEAYPAASPGDVWAGIHNANNVTSTPGWLGVTNRGAGSPNELLHYGSLNDGQDDGDPHITTVTGLHYDFQDGGEFVALSDGDRVQLQTRQTAVPSAPWVSVNTAIAAKVGTHRVTWQPSLDGVPDPAGLELRVDGTLTSVVRTELDWGTQGRVSMIGQTTLQIDFPEGTTVLVTPNWWSSQSQWYLTVRVFHTMATLGLMGDIERDSWLDPGFADKWRVTGKTTLFDYASGLSTESFTSQPFPADKIPEIKQENLRLAQAVCGQLKEGPQQKDCLADVATTGDASFVEAAITAEEVQHAATQTKLSADATTSSFGKVVKLNAYVVKHQAGGRVPQGTIRIFDGDKDLSGPMKLNERGQASWSGAFLESGEHRLKARFSPSGDDAQLPSNSSELLHTVEKETSEDHSGGGL